MLDELMETMTTVTECRICGGRNIREVVDLGSTPIAYRLLSEDQLDEPEPYYPLSVMQCEDCGFAQLRQQVDPNLLYPSNYPYDMETTQSAVDHFHSLAKQAAERVGVESNDLVVDIGSSTGVLLQGFDPYDADVLGIEPATEMAERARTKGIPTVSEFFTSDLSVRIADEHGGASVITATNLINQIDDLTDFIDGIETLLAKKGVFVFETPHLVNTLEDLHYDHIYHEHSGFFSLRPIERLVEQQDLRIVHIEKNDFRGGSIRCYVGRKTEFSESTGMESIRAVEQESGIYDPRAWQDFEQAVYAHRDEFNDLIYSIKNDGGTIAAISVTAKGNSFLNYCGLGKHDIEIATEILDTKIGKYTPGGHIPVVHDDELLETMPDYAIILAWNFADSIMDNLSEYSENGGKFIIPMPEPTVVE